MADQQLSASDQKKLDKPEQAALAALSKASQQLQTQVEEGEDLSASEELAQSKEFAQTLNSLQQLVEAKAKKLMVLKDQMKKKRQMIKDVFENDTQLAEVTEKKEEVYQAHKARKAELRDTPEVKELKVDLRELKDQQKDLEESLSNHLISYHQLTNSTSFDTSEGDQWEFKIKAKVKNKKL